MDSTDQSETDTFPLSTASPLRKRTIQRLLELNHDYGKGLNEPRGFGFSELDYDKDLSFSHTSSGLRSFDQKSLSLIKPVQITTKAKTEEEKDRSQYPQHSSDHDSELHEIGSSIDSSLLRTSPRRGDEELLDPLETSVDSMVTEVKVVTGGRRETDVVEKSEIKTVFTVSDSGKLTQESSGKAGRVTKKVEPRLFIQDEENSVSRDTSSENRKDCICQTEVLFPDLSVPVTQKLLSGLSNSQELKGLRLIGAFAAYLETQQRKF